MESDDRRHAPAGQFRVVGYDKYDYSDYVVDDVATFAEARQIARDRASVANALPTSFSDVYFVYDDEGQCLLHVTFNDLHDNP